MIPEPPTDNELAVPPAPPPLFCLPETLYWGVPCGQPMFIEGLLCAPNPPPYPHSVGDSGAGATAALPPQFSPGQGKAGVAPG